MIFETNKEKGRAGMALAIGYFGSNGYTVNIPLNDTQWYDLVIEKDGAFQTVQCKATGSKDNAIQLRSAGGTRGTTYDTVLNHPVDLLFCLNDKCQIFVIPVEDLRKAGVHNSVTLRDTPNKNGQGFNSYRYLVPFVEDYNQEATQTEKEKEKPIYTCPKCGQKVSHKGNYCQKCGNENRRIPLDEMPVTREELKLLIRTESFAGIGRRFQITDNSVRKWCDKFNLPRTKKEIDAYSNEEWALI